ncbi:unnamed protein product [Prorocentrum cordatum]|uniref:Uncharacterized protein n=1 Tax=Prorocentrum cordatum TaxID=2364126 RepID=A0ABN9S337_9DINO|nr:unnamed protein product [Polarella glacialis]
MAPMGYFTEQDELESNTTTEESKLPESGITPETPLALAKTPVEEVAALKKRGRAVGAREPQPYSLHTPRSDLYGTPRLERYGTPRLDPYGTPRRYSGPSPRSGSPSPRPDLLMLRDAPRPVV